ncbi:MAG: ABC transporter ATP-binding protein [Gammaproteobacteria bacterium]|nr:MAG: ABC transporter ATP-binding protein [Gammaproteobacteria bacterium]RLA16097.1 MAG: ABC transporter ATP-binding protein [Gammaproteobacteria bacterium]RLA18216.1 MAG: ABC transporter ATP-binding protein [Gammaproteobacteria bacterium]
MPTAKLIEVENVHRYFGAVAAVRDLSFSLHSGEVLGFLGPNGAGKSTTMRIITGNLAASAGSVTIGGYDLHRDPIAARRLLGYLPDTPPLYHDCTVEEFLRYCGRLHAINGSQLSAAVDRGIDRCGLGDVRSRLIAHLSKGYQQRVGIAQAIIHDPELVILDEPTVGLDPRQIEEIRQLISELGHSHSVILSTHILSEVQAVCSHVQIINRGELVLHSPLAELDPVLAKQPHQVEFQTPPSIEQLRQLVGINDVSVKEDGYFHINFTENTSGIDTLLAASLENGWGLRQLTAPQLSLEQLFMQLTDTSALPTPAPAEETT